MPGLYEVRINGMEIFHRRGATTDPGGLFDTRQRRNPDRGRVDKLSAISFDLLPVKDAFTSCGGNGKRKMGCLRGPELRLLQALRARPRRVDNVTRDPHVPVPDPGAGLAGEIQADLVRQGRWQTWTDYACARAAQLAQTVTPAWLT